MANYLFLHYNLGVNKELEIKHRYLSMISTDIVKAYHFNLCFTIYRPLSYIKHFLDLGVLKSIDFSVNLSYNGSIINIKSNDGVENQQLYIKRDSSRINKVEPRETVLIILEVFYLKEDNMKVPLTYQVSEFDCCPTTFINAIKYLYKRSEAPGDVVKAIYEFTLDRANGHGTTREGTKALTEFLNTHNDFDLECIYYSGDVVNLNLFEKEIKNSVIVVRLWSLYEHYVLITKIDNKYIYLFDPYYEMPLTYKADVDIKVLVYNNHYNRIVKKDRLDIIDNSLNYTLGEIEKRECVVMRRKR